MNDEMLYEILSVPQNNVMDMNNEMFLDRGRGWKKVSRALLQS